MWSNNTSSPNEEYFLIKKQKIKKFSHTKTQKVVRGHCIIGANRTRIEQMRIQKYPIISQQNGSQVRNQMIIKNNERHAKTGLESPLFYFSHHLELCWRMKPSAICCCTKSSRCSKNQSRVCGQYDQSMQQEETQNHLATYFSSSWRISVQCQYTGRSNYLRQRR